MSIVQNGYITKYLEECRLFTKTLVIKLNEAAELVNEGVIAKYGKEAVDLNHPETWKYYLNVSGQYHPTDTVMSVMSIDTLETIDFTRANLEIHTATKAAYQYGTRYYHTLVHRYPQQETLINHILLPANLQEALDAPNGTVLVYRKDLVEKNEVSLIPELETYLKSMLSRWYNAQFQMSDHWFTAAYYCVMMNQLLPWLLNYHFSKKHTNEVHSFHVQVYLASHQGLDIYLPYLTLKQQLWLYRNIAYLERNPGTMKTFTTVIDRILTERGIPLGEYTVRHTDGFEDYYSVLQARFKMLNNRANMLGVDYHDINVLIDRAMDAAQGNKRYYEAWRDKEIQEFQNENSTVSQTKMLHSSMVDYSNSSPEPFNVIALREWVHLAFSNMYNVQVRFKNPVTSEVYSVFAQEAFLYMLYVSQKADGYEPTVIPHAWLNLQQRRNPTPSTEDALSIADMLSVVPMRESDMSWIAQLIVTRQPHIEPLTSVSAFYDYVSVLTDEAYWHWFLTSSMGDMYERALVENMCRRLYEDKMVIIDDKYKRFGTFLVQNNLPTYNMSREEALLLVQAVFEAATGFSVDNTKQLKYIQKYLLKLFKQLISYSVVLTREINTEDIISINWPAVRLGNMRSSQSIHRNIETEPYVRKITGKTTFKPIIDVMIDHNVKIRPTSPEHPMTIPIDISLKTEDGASIIVRQEAKQQGMEIDTTWDGGDMVLEEEFGALGYTTFDALAEDQKRALKYRRFS